MKLIYVNSWNDVPEDFTGIAEWLTGTKRWLLNGKPHRLDGPAVEIFFGIKEHWIHGKYIKDVQAFNLLANILKLKGLG